MLREHTQRTMGSGYLRSLSLRFWAMERNKRTTRTESIKGMGISTGKRKTLRTHSIASKWILVYNIVLQMPLWLVILISREVLMEGATSVVASKTSVSLSPHLIRVSASPIFLCLAFDVENKWPSKVQILLKICKSPCALFFLWLWPGKQDSVICSLPSDRHSSQLSQH